MIITGQPGLGQLDISSLDLSGYTDESTLTGLPVYAEVILGVVAVFALSKLVGAGKSVSKSVGRRRRTQQRKAALRAQLASL